MTEVEPVWSHQRRTVGAVWMKTNMRQSNDTPKLTALEDHRPLADSALDAVSGGFIADYVKQLLASSEPFGTVPDVRKGGAIIVYDWEKTMSKTNDTSWSAALEDHGTLADSELDAVSGGWFPTGIISGAQKYTGGGVQDPNLYSGETVNGRRVQK
jgi:hypothetical protein